ncbi:glycosyltransferase family 39 protein [candidate division TA06 bacterium]|uniref:Glycosyltransferase family 39 protein n=1 Tax=candidate division TA06 bacterium TaxID=2250710 RepID=A0A933I8B3_UNCT6|nr:glycosyltransferase family 39 protein [candidate division TA06 bacterium]
MGKNKKISPQNEATNRQGFDLPGWAEKHSQWRLISVLALFVVLSLLLFDPKPFVGGDNAAYVSLSKSLAQGKGLTEVWTPEGKPHTQYPFGFPLLLAPVSLLKLPYAWYKLIPWLSGLLSLLAFGLLVRDDKKVLYALPVFLLAINPYFLEYTHWVLSELPFTFFVLLTFLLLKRWEDKGGHLWLAGAILSSVFANHTRSAGIALYLGIFLYLLFKRKFKASAVFIGGCIALTLPWALRNSHYGTSGGYLDQFLMRDPYQPESGFLGIGGLVQRFFANGKIYFSNMMPQMLFPAADDWGLSGGRAIITLLAVVPSITVLIARVVRSPKGYDGFVLIYLGMSLLWPETWSDIRFLLPLLPFLLFYMVQAYRYLLTRLFKEKALWPAVIMILLVAAANVSSGWNKIASNLEAGKYYSRDKYSGYDPAWRSFFAAAEWIKDNTPETSAVVSRKPSLFYLSSNRKSYCYPFTANRDSVLKEIDRADYIMVEPVSGTGQKYLIPVVQPLLDKKFKIIYANGNPPTYVLQVVKEIENAR